MTYREPPRPGGRRSRPEILTLLVVGAALAGALVSQAHASASSTAAPPTDIGRGGPVASGGATLPRGATASPSRAAAPASDLRGTPPSRPPGAADGVVPDGTTVFDDNVPGVAKLQPDLLGALRRAATAAARDGVELLVSSGWRSPEYQERLLRQAIAKYGSARAAARWVATPSTSLHVSGAAVDVAPSDAAAWLSRHGAAYGVCQTYRNEPWHYELRPDAVAHGCPPMYADPTHDPRMQP